MSLPIGYLTVMARFTIRDLISQNEVMKNALLNKPAQVRLLPNRPKSQLTQVDIAHIDICD